MTARSLEVVSPPWPSELPLANGSKIFTPAASRGGSAGTRMYCQAQLELPGCSEAKDCGHCRLWLIPLFPACPFQGKSPPPPIPLLSWHSCGTASSRKPPKCLKGILTLAGLCHALSLWGPCVAAFC